MQHFIRWDFRLQHFLSPDSPPHDGRDTWTILIIYLTFAHDTRCTPDPLEAHLPLFNATLVMIIICMEMYCFLGKLCDNNSSFASTLSSTKFNFEQSSSFFSWSLLLNSYSSSWAIKISYIKLVGKHCSSFATFTWVDTTQELWHIHTVYSWLSKHTSLQVSSSSSFRPPLK